jgi:membrane protein YqaA with SNARE-associated domain
VYAVAAHLLISVLLHEPALFYAAKIYPAVLVAVVGTLATVVAIVLDYWLIGWLVNHHLVKPVVEESRWFRFAQQWFRKAPFLLIAGSALAPVPFYPVKILAIASDYPLVRFVAALIIGRLPRFYVLAKIGGEVEAGTSTLGWITLALAAFGGWRIWAARKQQLPRR